MIQDIDYYINGINFTEYGVYVSASSGIASKPEVKNKLSVDWNDYHGIAIDRSAPRYKEREITLDCFIEAFGYDDFIEKYRGFIAQFEGANTKRLKIDVGTKPLVYEVLCLDKFDIQKKWNPDHMIGTFRIMLTEPEPVKRVLRHTGAANSTAQITMTTKKLVNVYWGDGTATFDVSGTNKQITHQYSEAGEYDIIVTGMIEAITAFTTNAIILWSRLL